MATSGLSLESLIEKRRICRIRFTKSEKSVLRHIENCEQLKSEEASFDKIELSVRTTINDMQRLSQNFNELQDAQNEIDFNPDNVDRLEKLSDGIREKEESTEQNYVDTYMSLNARVQALESKWLSSSKGPSRRGSNASDISRDSNKSGQINSKQLTDSLTEAFKSINTGLTGDQLSEIVTTLTKRKRELKVPKFKGEPELFDQWKELVEAELSKPGYSEAEQSHYVMSVLEGEALKVVLSLKNPSYQEMLHVLENKYGDTLVRIQQVVIEIANVNTTTSTNAKDLEPLYSKLITCWNYLLRKTDNDQSFVNSSWVLTALVRPKLPKSLVRRWDGERIKNERTEDIPLVKLPIKFDELLRKLREALQVARRTDVESKPDKSKYKRVESSKYQDRYKPSNYALNITKGQFSNRNYRNDKCVFCENNHVPFKCFSVKEMTIPERTEKVKAAKLCFNCLKTNHFVTDCKARPCSKCGRKHHKLLHIDKRQNKSEYPKKEDTHAHENDSDMEIENIKGETIQSTAGLIKGVSGPKHVLMQSGIAEVESNNCITKARVLFDSGSGVSFVSTKLAKKLNLKGHKVEDEFSLAGGSTMHLKSQAVKFYLSSAIPNWDGEVFEIEAYIIDRPSADLQEIAVDLSKMPYLENLQLADTYPRFGKAEVDIMLGLEDTLNIQLGEKIYGPKGMPVAQKTHLGWILSGACSTNCTDNIDYSVNKVSFEMQNETDIAVKHWELEHVGILPNECKSLTTLETEAIRQFKEKTKRVGCNYETGLIHHPDWENRSLKSNKHMAIHRLVALEKRLQGDPELAVMYENQLRELVKCGRAVKVESDAKSDNPYKWYLPHHPVIRMDKSTTKVRIVFDGSAKGVEGISLNDTLLPGPALQPDLVGVLLRFRKHKVAIVADVEKMFLQIGMNRNDQDQQRFLWRDLDKSKKPDEYRLTTVTFGLKCSPFCSIQTIFDHVEYEKDRFPLAASEIKENIFVDDVLTGAEDAKKGADLSVSLKQILASGGFPLRKFLSNDPKALEKLDEKDLATQHAVTVAESDISTKALGVKYIPSKDVLKFSFYEKLEGTVCETRRTVLRPLHRIYDPLGLLSPFTIRAKQLFQQAWTLVGGWDDQLPKEVTDKWLLWKNEVKILDQIETQRCFVPNYFLQPRYTLHAFGDACEASYGAVVYIRVEDSMSDSVEITNLCSKTRVAPLKNRKSIPELELTASLMVARLVKYVERELKLPIDSIFCWTDSRVALEWVSKPSYMWQTYVANRVAEIHGLVKPSQWKHVAGKQNPADLCSRGCSASGLVDSKLWWVGPEFLTGTENQWPKQNNVLSDSVRTVANRKQKCKTIHVANLTNQLNEDNLKPYVEKFETYSKFISVFTCVRSWVRKYRARYEGSVEENVQTPVKMSPRRDEEIFWLKWAQMSAFEDEIQALKDGLPLPKGSKLSCLDAFLDSESQLLRVGGRLQNARLPEEVKNPIIIPSHNRFSEMLIMHFHVINCHAGIVQTLANLRTRFWLVRGRQEVRRVLYQCLKCRNIGPAKQQKMASLPAERVTEVPPFMHVGVDFAGPLYIKVNNDLNKKVYIALFSCMVTRAVHLELIENMTAIEFLKSFERMVNRRGTCAVMYSDNAKTFKKASNVLLQLYKPENKKVIESRFSKKGIEWRFITEHAPRHGGFYERMVRSVKTPLKKILGKAKLTYSEMETVLTDVEAQINSRPLTDVSADKNDPLPLTPWHLVMGRHLQVLPGVNPVIKYTSLGRRWHYRQRLSKQFWKRWSQEYLTELNSFKKWREIKDNIKVDDVVLVSQDSIRKQDWTLGRVVEVHPGRDGLVRSVTLKTSKGFIRRPIQRLHIVEGIPVLKISRRRNELVVCSYFTLIILLTLNSHL